MFGNIGTHSVIKKHLILTVLKKEPFQELFLFNLLYETRHYLAANMTIWRYLPEMINSLEGFMG